MDQQKDQTCEESQGYFIEKQGTDIEDYLNKIIVKRQFGVGIIQDRKENVIQKKKHY